GTDSPRSHGPLFYEDVAGMVHDYLASKPDPHTYDFLCDDFAGLVRRHGGVVGTTFRNFPSFPQRYMEAVDMPAGESCVKIERLKPLTQPVRYSEDDLHIRHFTESSARRLTRKGRFRAA